MGHGAHRHPLVLLLASGGISLTYVLFYTITTFSLAYGTQELGLQSSTMLYCAMISVAVMGVAVPVFAGLSDRIGRRRLCLAATVAAMGWAFPLFWLLNIFPANPVLISLSVGMVVFAMLFGPMGAFLPELFGTHLRYSGAAVSYNLGGLIGGGLDPTIASQLLILTGVSWSISLYAMLMSVVGFVGVFFLSETYLSDLSEMRSEERGLPAEGIFTE